MGGQALREFDFKLDEIERRVSAGGCSDWREITVIARELIKLQNEVRKLRKLKQKVDNDE